MSDEERKRIEQMIASGNVGLTVSVKDKDGNIVDSVGSFQEAYNKGWIPGATLGAATDISGKLYSDNNGGYTYKEPEQTTIGLNYDTGEIVVTAPSYARDSETFKENVKSLEQLSAAYKLNPDARIPVLDAEGADTGKTQTIPQMLASLSKKDSTGKSTLDYWTEQAKSFYDARQNFKTMFPKQADFFDNISESDIIKAYTIAVDNKATGEKATDSSLQLISGLPEADFLRNSEGYDDETGMIDLKHLMADGWNRDKVSDDTIKQLQGALERYFAAGDFSDGEEFARNFATYRFMQERDPGVNFFRGTAENIGSFLLGLVEFGADTALNLLTLADYASGTKLLNEVILPGMTQSGQPFLNIEGQSFVSWLDQEQRDWFEGWQQDRALLNDGNVTMMALGDMLGTVLADIAFGSLAEGVMKQLIAKGASRLRAAADAIPEATKLLGAGGLSTLDAQIPKAARTLVAFLGAGQTATLFNGLSKILDNVVVRGSLAVLAETVAESVVSDPQLFRDVLASGNLDDEGREYLMQNWVWNAIGAGVAFGSSKAAIEFGKTAVGKAVSHNVSTKVKAITTKVADTLDAIRTKLRGVDDIEEVIKSFKNPKKQDAWRQARVLREADRAVAASPTVKISGRTKEQILEDLAAARKAVYTLYDTDNAITELARGGRGFVNRLTNSEQYPELTAATKAINKTTSDIIDAEKGLTGFKSAAKTSDGKLFSKRTTQYIGSVNRLDYLDNYTRINKETITAADLADIDKERVWLKDNIRIFQETATPALQSAADRFVKQNREWWGNFTDALVNEGVVSRAEVARLRALGYWGEDGSMYARAQRQLEMSEYIRARRDGRVDASTYSAFQHTAFGTTDDFVDPILVQQNELYRRADQYARQQTARARLASSSASYSVKMSGQTTGAVRGLAEAEPALNKAISSKVTAFGDSLRGAGIAEDIVTDATAHATIPRKVQARLKTESRVTTMLEATDDQIANVFMKSSGYQTPKEYMEATLALGEADDLEAGARTIFENYANTYYGALALEAQDGKPLLTLDNYRVIRDADDTFDLTLARGYCTTNTKALKDSSIGRMASKRYDTLISEYIAKSTDFGENALRVDRNINEEITTYVRNLAQTDPDTSSIVKRLAAAYGYEGNEAVENYIALRTLEDNLDQLKGKFREELQQDFERALQGKTSDTAAARKAADKTLDQIKASVTSQADAARAALKDTAPEVVDAKEVFDRVRELNKQITGYYHDPNVIALPDINGELEFIEVDPLLANLVKTTSPAKQLSTFGNFNYLLMKLFRLGTTGISLRSMVSQQFRDYLNAFIGGGMYRTVQQCAEELEDVFGSSVVRALADFEPDELKAVRELATREGISEGAAFAKRELSIGKALSPSATETDARKITKEANILRYSNTEYKARVITRMNNALDKGADLLGKGNEWRESLLRSQGYANAFTDAIKSGASLKQARAQAQYVMNTATTNFSRLTEHFTALQDTVPYLGAAINGSKSFWSLWSLDPVGVTGRLLGGVIIPTMYFTAYSLASKENREIWKNIPEYNKEDNILLVVNGDVISIPIPQEISALVNPFRQFVEHLHDANTHTFWQLAANDLLGLSPIEIDGFLDIDGGKILSDDSLLDHLAKGFVQIVGSNAPVYVKTAIMAITGIDPYTMDSIDKSYTTVDPDTGTPTIMDTHQYGLAKVVSDIANSFGWGLSASAADALLNSILGRATTDIADSIMDWGQAVVPGGEEGSWSRPLETLIDEAITPLTVSVYSQSEAAWRDAVNALSAQRSAILNSEAWDAYLTMRRQASTEADYKKVAQVRADLLDPYFEQVKTAVDNLITNYGQEFTHRKFATVLALLNTQEGGIDAGAYGDKVNQEAYQQGRRAAIGTMAKLGFTSSSNNSIFGYMIQGQDGSRYMRYYQPVQILNAQNMMWGATDTHETSIENLLKEAGLTRSAMFDGYSEMTKSQKKKWKQQWNARVVNALAPYIEKYGAATVINTQIADYLDNYIFVDNPYTTKQYLIKIFGGK